MERIVMLLLGIWKERCSWVFESKMEALVMVAGVQGLLLEFRDRNSCVATCVQRSHAVVAPWMPPTPNCMKINTDASMKDERNGAANESCCTSSAAGSVGCCHTEMMALMLHIELAKRMGIGSFIWEANSTTTVSK